VAQVVATNLFAGSERYAVNLTAGLVRLGADVVVVGGSRRRVLRALAEAGVEAPHLPANGLVEAYRRLHSLRQLDVVHAHLTTAEVAATLAYPSRSRVAVVATRHIAARRGASAPGRVAVIWVRARLDGQIAPSEYIAARVDGACQVLPTGVPDALLGPHDQPLVLVVQRLDPEKDTATALRAWAVSKLATKGWELHIAGSGSQDRALRALASELGLERSCRFLGNVDGMYERFARAGVLLAPARGEPFGLSVVEAMATGLPIVAASAGGHLETMGPVAGATFFQPGDHMAAANALRRLVDDPGARQTYGGALLDRQRKEYSLASFAARVSTWYAEVLTQRVGRHS
jgi:glycosyltransferase involved in cell wall biosynthesis